MEPLLYWNPFSGSLAPMALLEEVGAPYEKILININAGENRTAKYLKIHPLGLVPALRLPNGQYVFESTGICMYLVDKYPDMGSRLEPTSLIERSTTSGCFSWPTPSTRYMDVSPTRSATARIHRMKTE